MNNLAWALALILDFIKKQNQKKYCLPSNIYRNAVLTHSKREE
jgi:hypothetical protein